MISLFGWSKYFKYREIYPGSKTSHFKNFLQNAGFSYNEMLFFDDEQRNIDDIEPLGVTSVLVNPDVGINTKLVEDGLQKFIQNNQSR